jgi:hypothetical protein
VTGPDPVRRYLQERGAAAHVVEGGLEGLVRGWEDAVQAVADGYPLDTFDDYLNDLDGRQILADAFAVAPREDAERLHPRIAAADARFGALVVPTARPLWGERAAAAHGWTADRNWWYWSRPRRAGAELDREIDAALGLSDRS